VTLGFYPKSTNEIWINSTGGLQVYQTESNCITQSFVNDDTKSYSVDHIDDQGRIWSGTREHGFKIYSPIMQQYEFLRYEDPESEFESYSRTILEDTLLNRLYVIGEASRGLHIYDRESKQWNCIPPPDNYDLNKRGGFTGHDLAFLENGEILILEESALYKYKPGDKKLTEYPIQPQSKSPYLFRIFLDSYGDYWISSNNTIYRLNSSEKSIYSFSKELKEIYGGPLGGNHMAEDPNGNIWLRSEGGLLIYIRDENRFIYHAPDHEKLKSKHDFGPVEIDEQGRAWIASRNQYLVYAHADSIDRGIIRLFGREEGLIGQEVTLVKLYKGKLLVFTESGMQIFNPDTEVFEEYHDTRNGLNSLVSRGTILSDGTLAACRSKQIALFEPDQLMTNLDAPRPYVSLFQVFDQPWNVKNKPSDSDSIKLSYKQNFFSFEFSAINYTIPESTQFRYLLKGFEEDWKDGTERRFASYTNVPGGEYEFVVEAMNNEGITLGAPSTTYLSISTVWYKRIWFWILCVMLAAAVGYFAYIFVHK
jgi:hypothetical protein